MKTNSESVIQLLCPYGDWSHKYGMQCVDKIAGQKIEKAFNKSFDRFFGLPIYIGHPDDKASAKKAKAVGKIESVAATEEGIAISAKYSEDAYKKLSGGKLKWLSPRWRMEELGEGRFRPIKLISVGMTNNPNIPRSGALLKTENFLTKKSLENFGSAKKSCENLKKKIDECGRKTSEISRTSRRIKKEDIDRRIKDFKKTPEAHELASMAMERSKKTGETYIQSFAAIRRKYFGSKKI